MGLRDVNLVFTGGVDGGRGWLGDMNVMLLSIDKVMRQDGNQNTRVNKQLG